MLKITIENKDNLLSWDEVKSNQGIYKSACHTPDVRFYSNGEKVFIIYNMYTNGQLALANKSWQTEKFIKTCEKITITIS